MGEQRRHYTAEDKMRAAEAYVRRGGYSAAERETGIPWQTIQSWRNSADPVFTDWEARSWDMYMGELATLHARLGWEGTESSLKRIRDGDPYIYDGDVRYKPVTAKDAMTVAGIAYDKARIGLALPSSYGKADAGVEEQLKRLQDALEGRTGQRTSAPKSGEEDEAEPVH